MFVYLSKLLAPLVYPMGLSFCLWVAAAALRWRSQRQWSERLGWGGAGLIILFSTPAVSNVLLGSLENDYELVAPARAPRVDAIVVLGGVTAAPIPPRVHVEVHDSFDRLLHGARLWKAGRAPWLVLSGGVISYLVGSDLPEAERLAALAAELGVPREALLLEPSSRNTRENAVHTARLLRERGLERVLLVTSASHMRRAHGAFTRAGVAAIASPTDIQVVPRPFSLARALPDVESLRASTRAIKEYVGLVVYWLRGWV